MLVAAFACAWSAGVSQTPSGPQVAAFTQAQIRGSTKLDGGPIANAVHGTVGEGLDAERPVTLSGLRLNPVEGLIEVWIRPNWAGNDGKRHLLWTLDEAAGRTIYLEKSDQGLLRAVVKTPSGLTVSRGDVSNWRPGEWHQVCVGWMSHHGMNVGLPLWIDRSAVDGQITAHGVFDKGTLPTKITLGDGVYDELIVRPDLHAEGDHGMIACVYRDYFRTAPYKELRIDAGATDVPTDPRAVAGQKKQLGASASLGSNWDRLVENVVRYSQWGYFDARRLVTWSSSEPSVATIDDAGLVSASKPGRTEITASFHGFTARYPLTVISPEKPDLDAISITLSPRFRSDAVVNKPAPGQEMTASVRVGNYGLEPTPAGAVVRFQLIPDENRNFRLDADERPVATFDSKVDRSLAPGEETTVEFRWPFPARSTWMKVELDPDHKIDELCEANNTIEELTDARPVHMGYNPKFSVPAYKDHKLNHVGSFSYYDWIRAEKRRMDAMLRAAVYPTTSPNGVEEAYRIDKFTALGDGNDAARPFEAEADYYDGGFPVNEPLDMMSIDCAIIHEFGHTILSQPDLYGYVTSAANVFVTDDDGKAVAGTADLPVVGGDSDLPCAPGINVPCGAGYNSLMDGCQLWLPSSQAGHVMYYRGYRGDRFWGTQGRLIPTRANWLLVEDAYDHPLKGAAVYVYHVSQAPVQDSGAKYFADRPKFVGHTDSQGRFIFPDQTDQDWDDPTTDKVDGSISVWNPFGTATTDTAFTPNVWSVEGLLLIRVVSGKESEYRFMDLSQFNDQFLSGHQVLGKYLLRTSLDPAQGETPIVRRAIPNAIREVNKAPIAIAPKELTVKCGEAFTIDGSKSYDPEHQPLIFRWNVGEGWLMGSLSQTEVLKLKAPDEPKELEYKMWVNDGIRCSEAATIKVHVVK